MKNITICTIIISLGIGCNTNKNQKTIENHSQNTLSGYEDCIKKYTGYKIYGKTEGAGLYDIYYADSDSNGILNITETQNYCKLCFKEFEK